MQTTAAKSDLFSIGTLASHLQASVRMIEKTAETLGICPAMRINMIPHFDGEQVERIRAALADQIQPR